ncbi:single-stranded DNA-binding protein [Candidatus Gracilibacteria bacterium]|nr:single-stranded DNA-binding protein [Candidatus Gracilibacteria bacterium]MCF7819785.1 single-stranded DNA-binding protein [Candidatus Gracilibacteria bacterium]
MNSLNRAEIIGNITRDPELKSTKAGQSVTTIGVATNRGWTDSSGTRHDEAEFHNVVCWGKLAEISCQFLKKGAKVYFAGRLRTRSWEDESGVKHFRTEIVAQDMIMLSPKDGDNGNNNSNVGPEDDNAPDPEPDDDVSSEDLPF